MIMKYDNNTQMYPINPFMQNLICKYLNKTIEKTEKQSKFKISLNNITKYYKFIILII